MTTAEASEKATLFSDAEPAYWPRVYLFIDENLKKKLILIHHVYYNKFNISGILYIQHFVIIHNSPSRNDRLGYHAKTYRWLWSGAQNISSQPSIRALLPRTTAKVVQDLRFHSIYMVPLSSRHLSSTSGSPFSEQEPEYWSFRSLLDFNCPITISTRSI